MRHVVALAVLAGSVATATASPRRDEMDERECVAEVRGVRIAASPLHDGIAFVFTVARRTQLDGLRALLRGAAVMVERQTHLASLHPDEMPMADGEGAVPALSISVRNTPLGAIVSVRPELSLYVPLLQSNAHGFERFWSSHECVSVPAMARAPSMQNAIARR